MYFLTFFKQKFKKKFFRGLPHAHMLFTLDEMSKPRTAEDIDTIVCAEIPDPREDCDLHSAVVSHMIHGPCGNQNPNSPCMKNGKCKKHYPKQFVDKQMTMSLVTLRTEDAIMEYLLRSGGAALIIVMWCPTTHIF